MYSGLDGSCGVAFTASTGAYRQHVVTLHVWRVTVFTFIVELSEEIEGHDSIQVYHDR